MDDAIVNARSSQGHETFDDSYLTELCVKRKYMGHRNARFDLFLTRNTRNICQIQSLMKTTRALECILLDSCECFV